MKKTYKIILWMIFYIFTVIMIYNEYAKYSEVPSVNDFLENTLFKIQHILFTINIFFIILLTVVKIPIFSPNFIIRYKNHIIEVIFIQGVKLAVFFTSVTSAAYILPSLLLGNSLILKPELFIFIAGILSFVLSVYIEYVTILLFTNHQVLSLLSPFLINIVKSLFLIYFSSKVSSLKNINTFAVYCCSLIIIFMAILSWAIKKKEYINET